MNLVFALDKTKNLTGEDPNDHGLYNKNVYLGNKITQQMKEKVPKFRCHKPDEKDKLSKENKTKYKTK